MLNLEFLGWDRPFLERAADWLLERRNELPELLVVTPTAQGGRRLLEELAVRAGGVLAPRMSTPGALLKTPAPAVAADWVERMAWMETLEGVNDWSVYQELFPEPPGGGPRWSAGLARELVRLRHSLQENGHTLSSASKFLVHSIEAGRWDALAGLEAIMEQHLRAWGQKSRSRVLAAGVALPGGIHRIVLAGVTEMPPLVERALTEWSGPVDVLIAAPPGEADSFSPTGRPLASWLDRVLPWPENSQGSVVLASDPRQQAAEALRLVAEAGTPADEVALGTADAEDGDGIAEAFTLAGWTAFHPAATPLTTGTARWLRQWAAWLEDPTLAILADLLAMPETAELVKPPRATLAETLSRLRDNWVLIRPEDLRQRMRNAEFHNDGLRAAARELIAAIDTLEDWRTEFSTREMLRTTARLLDVLENGQDPDLERIAVFREWLDGAADMMRHSMHPPHFWIRLMLEETPPPSPVAPEGRVIDVQGWLELLLEPGRHLVVCGMNEGKVPARETGDPWLGEAAMKTLGLVGTNDRAARDAFLYQAMSMARRDGGRVDWICAKCGPGGEALLPSRLLLAAEPHMLPQRVRFLFRELPPPEAGLHWHADWKWKPRAAPIPTSLAVTSLAAYLACPFRFYLKFGLRMQAPDTGRVEWNARDFGNVAHEILENWGRDPEARNDSKSETLHTWFCQNLDRIIAAQFGKRIPLAVRIQAEALRQRLLWLARAQACSRAEGWEVIEVEREFVIPIGETTIKARIDRIDRHMESGRLRVLDYKTGKTRTPESAHRQKITARTVLPAHLDESCPAFFNAPDARGTPSDFRWTNLQLPLYVLAVRAQYNAPPIPCYFQLGNTEADVGIASWDDFSESDLQSASNCAHWIVTRIRAGVFWPPAEKVEYDDFANLAMGRNPADLFEQPDPLNPDPAASPTQAANPGPEQLTDTDPS
jgi:ATP-dependent helicase/nuclease subunit B